MNASRQCLLAILAVSLAMLGCPPRMSQEEQQVRDFAADSFDRMRNIVDPQDETATETKFVGNHVEVASENWVYILDDSGCQLFRSKNVYPHLAASFSTDLAPTLDQWMEEPVPQSQIEEARQLAKSLLGIDYAGNTQVRVVPVRELVASKGTNAKAEAVKYHEGRTTVMFIPPISEDAKVSGYETSFSISRDGRPVVDVAETSAAPRSFETAISFAPGGGVVRAETALVTSEAEETVCVFHEALASGLIEPGVYDYFAGMQLGTFFDPEEVRFELTAYSYEGEEFLDPNASIPCGTDPSGYYSECNPYYMDFFPIAWCANDSDGDAAYYITLPQYKYWCWFWWYLHDRKNGMRGNWDAASQSWEYDVHVARHRSLDSYSFVGSTTGNTAITTCDGASFTAPLGTDLKLEPAFYNDLELCHVAMISTHGGPLYSPSNKRHTYHFRRDYDKWIKLHEEGDDGLGKGNLRHLFLETCASMNWIFGPANGEPKNIETDWMNGHVADGIRTVCGADGTGHGYDRGGWRFFGSYHRGESISQSWINSLLTESELNHPVVMAYGSTEEEAAATLLDGRFTKTRGGTGWVVGILAWVEE